MRGTVQYTSGGLRMSRNSVREDEILIAVRSGTLIWCKGCYAVVPVRNKGKRWLICKAGHRLNSISVAMSLSTDDDETPSRILPPLQCRPAYWLDEMEQERAV